MKNKSKYYRIPVCIFIFVVGSITAMLFASVLNDVLTTGSISTDLTDFSTTISGVFGGEKPRKRIFCWRLWWCCSAWCILSALNGRIRPIHTRSRTTSLSRFQAVRDSMERHGSCLNPTRLFPSWVQSAKTDTEPSKTEKNSIRPKRTRRSRTAPEWSLQEKCPAERSAPPTSCQLRWKLLIRISGRTFIDEELKQYVEQSRACARRKRNTIAVR